ncbi:heme o synthase [Synechococcus sp. C9]|uniref:heme o synthase n=1 Tax=Synechococcus sp. C9 TaxID=102119 RepID=UPI001FF52DDC|nr:heme o synthase [Synechococcus sp. C9]
MQVAGRETGTLWGRVRDYIQLMKPRIIVLLLVTTAGAIWLASQGEPDTNILLTTLFTGTLAAGSANTINCLYDRDIDRVMVRTQRRPIPAGRITPWQALVFAVVLAVGALVLQVWRVNVLSALLEWAGILVYVLVYTHWLKRSSPQNIVIGGAAGAIPPLVGWAAVTGELSACAWILFAIIFIWTPPHFWALALMIREDYAQVGVPMLPVVAGSEQTTQQILLYTLLLIPTSLLLVYPCGVVGGLYALIALALGGIFLYKVFQLFAQPQEISLARSVFKYSILYLMLLSLGMGLDRWPLMHTWQNVLVQKAAHWWG